MAKKPSGGKPFDELMRKLAQVPKRELDRQVKRDQAKKKRKSSK